MPEGLARLVLILAAAHLVLGALFAIAFHAKGLLRVDPTAIGAGLGFRALVTPGFIVLWPLLALRWLRATQGGAFLGQVESPASSRALRATHRALVSVLAVLLPLIVAASLSRRPAETPRHELPRGLRGPAAAPPLPALDSSP